MTKVIAALDNSLAASPVLATALAFGQVFDADVEATHVSQDGARIASNVAAAAQVPLRIVTGPVAERLIALGQASDVKALVLGARGSPLGRRALGETAMAVATSLTTPTVVVPPHARTPGRVQRVLIPLEGDAEAHTPRTIIELGRETLLDVVVLHVLEEHAIPPFTDQPQHEQPARDEEFLRRFSPWGIGNVRVEMRVGLSEEIVPRLADESGADVVALGWSQVLQAGRAPIVRAALERCSCPVMLVPVDVLGEGGIGPELAGALES